MRACKRQRQLAKAKWMKEGSFLTLQSELSLSLFRRCTVDLFIKAKKANEVPHTQVGNKPPYARKPRTDRPPALTTGQAPQYMNYLPRLSRITAPRTQIMGRTHAAQTSNRKRPCTPHVTAPQPTKTGPPPDVLPLRPTQTRPPPAPPATMLRWVSAGPTGPHSLGIY